MKKNKSRSPYLTFGLGYEEDEALNLRRGFYDDVLDLAEYLIKRYPKERYSIMHKMFTVGFRCGQRCERRKNKNRKGVTNYENK